MRVGAEEDGEEVGLSVIGLELGSRVGAEEDGCSLGPFVGSTGPELGF